MRDFYKISHYLLLINLLSFIFQDVALSAENV